MNARIASFGNDTDRRLILAFDVFRWTLRLGFAIAPRDMSDLRRRRRRWSRLPDIPPDLRADIGLPPIDGMPVISLSIWQTQVK